MATNTTNVNTRATNTTAPKIFFSSKTITDTWSNYVMPNIQEEFRLLPDSILIGAGIFALLTQSFSMVIFFISMLETVGLNAGLQSLFGFLDKSRLLPSVESASPMCKTGFVGQSPILSTFSTLKASDMKSTFPSPSILFLSTASTYTITSLYTLKDELEQLGPEYSARFYLALFSSFLFLLTIISYRMYHSCDTVGPATLSMLLGVLIGSLLVAQNILLFGKNSINMIGIPLLRERTKEKQPIYVCPSK